MNRVAAIILVLCLVASFIEAKPHFLSKKSRGRGIGGNEPGGKRDGPGRNSHEQDESDEYQFPLDGVQEAVGCCLSEFLGALEEFGSCSLVPSWISFSDGIDCDYYGYSDWGCDGDPVCRFVECTKNAFPGEQGEVWDTVYSCLPDDVVGSFDDCMNNAFDGEPGEFWDTVYSCLPDDAVGSFDDCMNNAFDGEPATVSSEELSRDVDDERDVGSGRETSKEADMKKEAAHNAARTQKAKKMMAKKSSIMKALAQKRAMAKGIKKKHAA